MTTIYVTSDWHIGHRLVADHRGFADTDEHDNAILDGLAVLTKRDRLKVLGDLTVNRHQLPRVFDLVDSLPCPVDLYLGNHDEAHPMHRNSHLVQRPYLEHFASIQAFGRMKMNGQSVLLSHFPYHSDRGPVRFSQYRLRDEGQWLLHGHTHGTERFHDAREIHVGVDAWNLTPVSIDTIAKIIRENTDEPVEAGAPAGI